MNKKRVLALGYIPKWRGGRQQSGLATGIFDLHNSVNSLNKDVEVIIAATDIFDTEKMIDNTLIIGWSRKIIIKHIIKRFYKIPFFVYHVFLLTFKSSILSFFSTLAKVIFLDYAIEKTNPDIIHFHGVVYANYIKTLWRNKRPVILRIHGITGFDSNILHHEEFRKLEQKIINYNYSVVTFVTSKICKEWKSKYGKFNCPMLSLINGFDNRYFFPSIKDEEKKYNLITIASVIELKGQERVIKAIKKIKDKKNINLSYLIVGGGNVDYINQLKQYVSNNNLNVYFMDYCPQKKLRELLWKSCYFIQPSSAEGFGKTYIESIASGIPVILPSNLPIVQENHIISKDNSILLADASVDSIYNVLCDLDFNKQYSSICVSKTVDHLSWNKIALLYIDIYHDIY